MYTQSSLFLKNQRKNKSTKKPNFDLLSPGDYYEKISPDFINTKSIKSRDLMITAPSSPLSPCWIVWESQVIPESMLVWTHRKETTVDV